MKKLFLWQKIIIGIVAILTIFAVFTNDNDLNISSLLFGAVMGMIVNVLILYIVFLLLNRIYIKFKK